MGIKNCKRTENISKSAIKRRETCSAEMMTVVFSFHHLSKKADYNFRYFDKKKKNSETSNAIVSFVDKMAELSRITWEQLYRMPRQARYEYLDVTQFENSFINSLDIPLAADEKLMSVRFNGQNSRFIMKRGTKCSRVAHILGIDYDLKLYDH